MNQIYYLDEFMPAQPIEAGTSLEFLQAVYRDPGQPVSRRMRAAIAALPFETPKLSATATFSGDGFAARLEEAIARSWRATELSVASLKSRELP